MDWWGSVEGAPAVAACVQVTQGPLRLLNCTST
jgi:hypothetical protein